MAVILKILVSLLPMLYLALAYLYGVHFFRQPQWVDKYLSRLVWLTVGLHGLTVLLKGFFLGRVPLANPPEAAFALAFILMLVYLFIEYRIETRNTGFFIVIITLLIQFYASALIDFQKELPEILKDRLFLLHTTSVMIGYAALFISAIYGFLYLMLHYQVRGARFGIIYRRLPSLDILQAMTARAALIGFIFLTVAIFVGIIWRKAIDPNAPHFDPQVVSAYVVWIVYGLVNYGNSFGRWSGRWLAYLAVSGFIFILFSWIARPLLPSFHHFG